MGRISFKLAQMIKHDMQMIVKKIFFLRQFLPELLPFVNFSLNFLWHQPVCVDGRKEKTFFPATIFTRLMALC
jgi:hypothetical protein